MGRKIDFLIKGLKNPDKVYRYILYNRMYNPRKLWIIFHPIFWGILHPRKEVEIHKNLLPYFQDKKGIRIGGDLRGRFQKYLMYSAEVIDVNIAQFYIGQPTKVDYLTDATNLYFAKDGEFDFVCSSHLLEHIANPIKALHEQIRVIKKGGIIYCGLPDKRFTFDYKRQRTPLRHLIDDYQRNVGPNDMSHIQEFIDNWDESMDGCCNREQFLKNIRTNPLIYTHHHVWIKKDIVNLFKYVELEIIYVDLTGDTINIVGKKQKT